MFPDFHVDDLGLCYCDAHRLMRCERCCLDFVEPNEEMLEDKLEDEGCDAAMKRLMLKDPFTLKVYLMWALGSDPTMELKINPFIRELTGTLFASDSDLEEDVDDFVAEHRDAPMVIRQASIGVMGHDYSSDDDDDDAFSVDDVQRVARDYGYDQRQHERREGVLDFHRRGSESGSSESAEIVRVWYRTGTVGTYLDHPTQQRTQLFRRDVTEISQLCDIFDNPRVHTGHGYHRRTTLNV